MRKKKEKEEDKELQEALDEKEDDEGMQEAQDDEEEEKDDNEEEDDKEEEDDADEEEDDDEEEDEDDGAGKVKNGGLRQHWKNLRFLFRIQSWARDNFLASRQRQRDNVIEPQGQDIF